MRAYLLPARGVRVLGELDRLGSNAALGHAAQARDFFGKAARHRRGRRRAAVAVAGVGRHYVPWLGLNALALLLSHLVQVVGHDGRRAVVVSVHGDVVLAAGHTFSNRVDTLKV